MTLSHEKFTLMTNWCCLIYLTLLQLSDRKAQLSQWRQQIWQSPYLIIWNPGLPAHTPVGRSPARPQARPPASHRGTGGGPLHILSDGPREEKKTLS